MKLNSILKVMLVAAVAACFSLNADAQFGGLLNKAKNKAKEVVKDAGKDAKNTAKETAKEKVNEAVGGKKTEKPYITENSSVPQLIEAYYYWADLDEKAINKKDLEWLCGDNGKQTTNMVVAMSNHSNASVYKDEIAAVKKHFNDLWEAHKKVKYEGKPTSKIADNNIHAEHLAWYVDKAKKSGPTARAYYTVEACLMRFLNITKDGFSDDSPVAEQLAEMKKLWNDLDEGLKAKNSDVNPYNTRDDIIALKEQGKKEMEREAAERKAKRQAEIDANTKTAKELTGSMNAQWNAKVFKLAKERVPDCTKVIVYSNAWDVKRQGSTILRRCIYAWVVKPDGTATDYGFCEDYQGGGKYGSLRNYSIGMRHVFVK